MTWLKEHGQNLFIMLASWALPIALIAYEIVRYGQPVPAGFVTMEHVGLTIFLMLPWGYGMQCIYKRLLSLE